MKNIFNRKNLFIFLMSISTFALAGSAAYYSVFGLSSLFAGARLAVIVMAGTLEFSKLIIASYLHNNWKTAGWMKWYLTLAVLTLMAITSAGIYGFLTSAYQTTADQLSVMDKQVNVIELKKERFQDQLDYLTIEKKELSESITDLRNGLSNNVVQYKDKETGQILTTTSSSQRRSLERQLETALSSRDDVSRKIEVFTDSITSLDLQILDLESNNEVAAEVGPLRYMSEITGKPMAVIVNWFTLLIVFVFDPLAISMVIALNKLTNKHNTYDDEQITTNSIGDTYDILTNPKSTDADDGEDGESLPILREEVEEEGEKAQEEEGQEVEEVSEVSEKESEEVEFIPTDEDAKKLYGEETKTPKHTYKHSSLK